MRLVFPVTLFAALLLPLTTIPAQAGTATATFTYQGQLTENGQPAAGNYDFELALYDQDSGGSAVAVSAFEDVNVSNGLFQLSPDFTSAPFEAGLAYCNSRLVPLPATARIDGRFSFSK